ncbi:MAG: response regulator transcription factor [Deltaproteobacteria bacterium]|nr:MAG: response regulator transcription factor [Deltaproteobacteria bacterium]
MNATPSPLILVFDDDLIAHQDFLGGLPARFVYRANADDAVSDVAALKPDCVFMDFSMNARLSGAQATERLRAAHAYDALPIVAISSDTRLNRKIVMAGATYSVAKMAIPDYFGHILRYVITK